MPTRTLESALLDGPIVLDGGLATELERAGHDISSSLWSARLLHDEPAAIVAAHAAFFAAGAQVATTSSYQASFAGFAGLGLDADATARLLIRSVELARLAADDAGTTAWVAASVGPYGATLADGSEYTGAYAPPSSSTVRRLREFHRRRFEILAGAGADVLACETVPAAAEAEALLAEIDRLNVPAWLSLTTITDRTGAVLTRRGEPAADVFAMARDVDAVIAVGVNCTDPTGAATAVRTASEASGKPVVVYPNSGELWDADNRCWYGAAALEPRHIRDWLAAGARLIGGCCRVGPEHLRAAAGVIAEG